MTFICIYLFLALLWQTVLDKKEEYNEERIRRKSIKF